MDEDVTKKTSAFVVSLFSGADGGGGGIDDARRAALAQWVGALVSEERQGWLKKLQMSLKEIEKERRLALDAHARIHALNARFDPLQRDLRPFREASMYCASDADSKVSHVDQLERNLNALFDTINFLQHEREQSMRVLDLNDDEDVIDVAQALTKRLSRLEEHNKHLRDAETRREKEIRNLQETLDLRIQVSKNEAQKHEQKVKEFKKTIADLRAKVRVPEA